jgi:hypothetical protein
MESILVRVLHAAKLANGQALAGGLQFFVAHVFFFAGLQALGGRLVGCGHGAVAGHVFFSLLVTMDLGCYL